MVLRKALAVCRVMYQFCPPYHWNSLLNSITSATVTGASPTENSLMVCGTLSSRIRKYLRPICGTKLFLLSKTATSTVTRLVSAENVADAGPPSSFGFGASFEGIFGSSLAAGAAGAGVVAEGAESGAVVGVAAFRGRATVSLPTEIGPSCADKPASRPKNAATATIDLFIATFTQF